MKWIRETKAYMWANYYSEDGNWKAYDEDIEVVSNRTKYNYFEHKMENIVTIKHVWRLVDLRTNEIVFTGKTLKSCKEYAENR